MNRFSPARLLVSIFLLGGLILLSGLFALSLRQITPGLKPIVPRSLPDYALPSLMSNEARVLSHLSKGHVSLLHVWATWCSLCSKELTELEAIKTRWALPLYGIAYQDSPQALNAWLGRQKKAVYDELLSDFEGRLGVELGVTGVPETFVLDKAGRIRYRYTGPLTVVIFEHKFLPIIEKLENNTDDAIS